MKNLYEILDKRDRKIVARITADIPMTALRLYRENGGRVDVAYIPLDQKPSTSTENVLEIYE
ncbi:TPA: hypothetical protein ACK3RU_008097 [Burkholderia cepacia]